MALSKLEQRIKRKRRIRKKVLGSPACPRLSVYRSLRYVYGQIIDDLNGKTLVAANSVGKGKGAGNKSAAREVGELLAKKAQAIQIKKICFDRNGFIYHGVVKELADAARKGGLEF